MKESETELADPQDMTQEEPTSVLTGDMSPDLGPVPPACETTSQTESDLKTCQLPSGGETASRADKDRLATSPPCEVTSTTLTSTAKQAELPSKVSVTEGIIAESGEKVIIEEEEEEELEEVDGEYDMIECPEGSADREAVIDNQDQNDAMETDEIDDVEPGGEADSKKDDVPTIATDTLVGSGVSITRIKRKASNDEHAGAEETKGSSSTPADGDSRPKATGQLPPADKCNSTNSDNTTKSSNPDEVLTISKVGPRPRGDVDQAVPEVRRRQRLSGTAPTNNLHHQPRPHPFFSPRLPGGFRPHPPMGPRGPMLPMSPGQRMMMRGQYRGPGPMPNLQSRPAGPLSLPPSLPSSAGPVARQLNKVAAKLAESLKENLKNTFATVEAEHAGDPEAVIKRLQQECEKIEWRHQQEVSEMKHNADLIIMEMRSTMEKEKQKALHDCRKQAELEKQKAILEMKKKQWCAHCGKEAIFYCCWNTSYCDYPCQQAHWPSHMATCAQNSTDDTDQPTPPQQQPPIQPPPQHYMHHLPPHHPMRVPQHMRMPGDLAHPMRFGVRPPGLPSHMSFPRPYYM